MKKIIQISLIAFLFVVGCQSSAPATLVVSAQPQATDVDPNQCTDRGWADITNYLYQFDEIITNADMKTNASVVLSQLKEIKNNVNEVDVDNCTENAHNSVNKGLDNRITGMQFMADGDNDSAYNYIHFGNRLIILAKDELVNYRIDLKYPKK